MEEEDMSATKTLTATVGGCVPPAAAAGGVVRHDRA
eukprot:SAG11_NODE_1134_length_5734_cov_4.917480_6_plen_36_part_00